jgi:cation:H+ antiporter
VLLALLALRLELGRATGLVFLALLVLANVLSLRWAKRSRTVSPVPEAARASTALGKNVAWAIGGLLLLLGGAHLLVEAAVSLARAVGLSDFVIGVTLVAVGTSLPELATSFVAGLRKEADLVVGNIVGSNLFNILGALGLSATLRPLPIDPALLRFEIPALVGFTLAMAVFLTTGAKVVRWEGAALLLGYGVFIALVL